MSGDKKLPKTVDCGDKRMDHVSRDIPEDREVWMSYTEAARALGIDVGSVKKRARRRGWRRQPGNDGTTRIAVPRDALGDVPRDVSKDGRGDTSTPKMALSPGTSPETDAAIQALQGQIAAVENHNATLREQLAKAEDRAERAEERAEKAEQRLIDELVRLAGSQHAQVPETNGLDEAETAEVLAELEAESAGHAEPGDGQLAAVPDSDPTAESHDSGEGRSELPALPDTDNRGAPPAPRSWWRRLISRAPRRAL